MEEEKKKKSNVLINTFIVFMLVIVCMFMYAKYIGTSGVRVKEYRVSSERIPLNFSGIKVIYFSDFIYSGEDDLNLIQEAVDRINLLKPDIVLFGGGLIAKGYKFDENDVQNISKEFVRIDSSLGKYAVTSFDDNENVLSILNDTGFIVLDNAEEDIFVNDNSPICLVGVSSFVKGSYDLTKSFEFKANNPGCYTIMFSHEGDIVDKVKALPNKPDLVFVGNSLGGEIRIPFYGGLFRYEGSMNYYEDFYQLDGFSVYVSSGFGTLEIGMRFNNRPSFNFFRFKSLH